MRQRCPFLSRHPRPAQWGFDARHLSGGWLTLQSVDPDL